MFVLVLGAALIFLCSLVASVSLAIFDPRRVQRVAALLVGLLCFAFGMSILCQFRNIALPDLIARSPLLIPFLLLAQVAVFLRRFPRRDL